MQPPNDAIDDRISRLSYRGWMQRILDWFYGYDYFISYRWSDGRAYAVALAEQLEQKGFDCFLDSEDYAKGDNWRRIGARALKQTSRLLLVGSPHAVRPDPPRLPEKDPVLREVRIFTESGKRIIPINFDGTLAYTSRDDFPLARFLEDDTLWIQEPLPQLIIGPSSMTLLQLQTSFNHERQAIKRARVLRNLVGLFGALSIAATIAAIVAIAFFLQAEQRQRVAQSRQLAAQSQLVVRYDPVTALSLAIAAAQQAPTDEAEAALVEVLEAPMVRLMLEHHKPVTAVAWSPDATMIATGDEGGSVCLWDPAAQKRLHALRGQSKRITTIEFSSDSKRIVAGAVGGISRVWDTTNGSELFALTASKPQDLDEQEQYEPPEVVDAKFSADGKRIVTTYDSPYDVGADLWDGATGQRVAELNSCEESRINAVFSQDSRRLVVWGSHCSMADIVDSATGQTIGTLGRFDPNDAEEQQGSAPVRAVEQVAISPDGKTAILVMWHDATSVWNLETQEKINDLGQRIPAEIQLATFSSDGQRLLTAHSNSTITIWDTIGWEATENLAGHSERIHYLKFSDDNKRIVSFSQDNSVRIWKQVQFDRMTSLVLGGGPTTLKTAAIDVSGTRVVTADGTNVARVWDTETSHPLQSTASNGKALRAEFLLPGDMKSIRCAFLTGCQVWNTKSGKSEGKFAEELTIEKVYISPDGSRLFLDARGAPSEVRQALTGKLISSIPSGHGHSFSKDFKRVICLGDYARTGTVYDLETGQQVFQVKVEPNTLRSVELSSDGKIALVCEESSVRILDAGNGELKKALQHEKPFADARFTPDGLRVMTCDFDSVVRCWNWQCGSLEYTLNEKAPGDVYIFSPGGSRAVIMGEAKSEKGILLIDPRDGRSIALLNPPGDYIKTRSFSPDGSRFIISSWDRIARIWDTRTGQLLGDLVGHTGMVNAAKYSPDGSRIATGSSDGNVKLWDASTRRLLNTFHHGSSAEFIAFTQDGSRILASSDSQSSIYPAILTEVRRWADTIAPVRLKSD